MAHHSKPAAIFIVHGPGIDPGPLVQGLASRGVSVRAGSAGDLPAEPKEKILWLVSTKEDLDRLACREKSSVASPCFVLMEPSLRSLFNEPSPGAYEIMPLPDTEADIKALADVLTRDGETGPAHTATLAVSHAPEAYGETMDSDSSGGAEISPPSEEHNTLPPQDSLSGAFDETVASDSGRGSQGGATNRAQTSGSILDSDADTLPEGSRVENWTIGPLLGKGGMGAVYRAYDPDLKRDIALKILSSGSPTAVERFRTEAVAVARIKNPGVATVHRTGLFRGHNYIAMELVDGMDLDRFVTKNRPPLRKRVALLEQVASVIREAHTKGVIHRDLKPANIMVQPDETVKVLDFGLAKMREDESDRVKVTADNAILGTPAYMAPEQAASRHDEVDTRTDVYALGTILYELIAGERPFKEKSLVGLIHALVYEEPTPLRAHGIKDHDLEAIVNTCLEKRPHDRYQSVGLFMADLARWQRGDEVMVRPRSILARSWALLKRHYVIAAALLLAVLLTAGLLTYREIDKRRRVRTLLAQSQQNIQRVEVLARAVKEFLFLSRTDKSKLDSHFSILETAKELEQETVNALTTIETAQRLRPTGEARRLLLQLYILRITLAEDTQDEPIKRLYRTMALNRFHDPAQRARIIGRGTIRFGDRARGARVTLFTILPDKRGVLLPQKPRSLGTTPLGDASLPQGSYLLRFEKTGHTPTLFPVLVRRNLTQVVDPYVFPAEAIPRGYVYVPGGISMLGNPSDTLGETAWTWSFAKVEGFFIRRYPFTFAELTRFIAQRPEGKRQLHSSFYRGKPVLRYEEGKGGILNIQGTDFPEGTTVKGQDWRRVAFGLLDYRTATEVVAWEGNSLGLECAQIPSKEEYQRAARGADGRTYPWGNVWVKKAGAAIEGRQQFPMPTPPGTHKLDTSPFGVSDLSGNVSSWTRSSYKSAFGEAPDYRLVAGGAYSQFPIPTYYFQWFDLSEAADEVSVRPVISLKCFFQSQKKTGP